MARVCAACGVENPDVARFCLACGSALDGQAAKRSVRERKYAAALFADLVGSTSLGEREDPEVVQSLIAGTFRRLTEEVERYGGIVDKVMGDAILAIFGVPAAHEDDPERAVRAALEMQAVHADLSRAARAEGRPALELRIGVEAGEVMVNIEPDAALGDRMLTGDAVNTAARLQSAAVPGRVWVGPAVYASTREVVEYRELPPLALKGKAELVPAWEALGVTVRRAGERPRLGFEAHLVGRDEEMSVLKETFHRVRLEGRSALVTVIGPAGVGKSRLVWEFQKYVEGLPEQVAWLKGRCLAYGNPSYSALAEAVKLRCGIHDDDPPDIVRERVAETVRDVFGDSGTGEAAAHIELLVGTADEDGAGVVHREELFETWRRFLERIALTGPLVLVLEDVHWADEGLFDFVDQVADLATGPVLLLTLARPELIERRPTWGGGKRNYAAVWLEGLTPEENESMLLDLLGDALPPEVLRTVVDRAEGNPLFTEELVRSFMDLGIIRLVGGTNRWELARPPTDFELPRSIHGLIATRLDSLPVEEKAVIQDASVIGRIFWNGTVARLSERDPAEVRSLLSRLRVKELVIPREPSAFTGEQECAFRHALIRDVAYDSLPKAARAEKHAEVARWAERQSGERAPEFAELLATHYAETVRYFIELGETGPRLSDTQRELVRWARMAGDRAARLWEAAAAVRWYRTVLDHGEAAGMEPVARAQIWSALARAGEHTLPHPEVIEALERARALFDELGLAMETGGVEARLAMASLNMGRADLVFGHLARAMELLEPQGDSADLAVSLHVSGVVMTIMERQGEGEALQRRAVAMAERVDPSGELAADFSGELGGVIAESGRLEEGLPMIEEGYRRAVRRGNLEIELRLAPILAMTLERSDRPDPERCEEVLRRAIDLSLRQGLLARACWSGNYLGMILLGAGRVRDAVDVLDGALRHVRSTGQAGWIAALLGSFANALAVAGRLRAAEDLMAEWSTLNLEEWARMDPAPGLARARLAQARGDLDAVREAEPSPLKTRHFGESHDLLVHWVRAQVADGRADLVEPHLAVLRDLAISQPLSAAYLPWVEGLVTGEDASLAAAVDAFTKRGRPVSEVECLLDRAAVLERSGADGGTTRERAEALAQGIGALLFVPS
ncbi:MAG TPA: AAA family ATPase [Actinomycetota bacterium]|jgi:class 3 adenylate cyclase/tetratricopeptide (TPR) repeat protein